MIGKVDNIRTVDTVIIVDWLQTYLRMTKLSMYKYMPYALKDFFFVDDSIEINQFSHKYLDGVEDVNQSNQKNRIQVMQELGVYTMNGSFINHTNQGLQLDDSGKRLIIQHLIGMHEPYYDLDEKTNIGREEEFVICMDLLKGYFDQLQELGVYDSCSIIITADHGLHMIESEEPIMLIKKSNQHNDQLQVSHVPGVLQSDVLPTLLDLANLDGTKITNGISLYQLQENQERYRFLRAFSKSADYPNCPKCDAVGDSMYNHYSEYQYFDREHEVDEEKDLVKEAPIYDFWW